MNPTKSKVPKIDFTRNVIPNMYEFVDDDLKPKIVNNNYDLHNLDLPLRMIFCSPSGQGKTQALFYLLSAFCQGKGTFADIHIITAKGASKQPIYDQLRRILPSITIEEGLSHCPRIDDFDADENHLIIFDDLMLAKNVDEYCGQYFIRGRTKNISVIFISQSYFEVPRRSIRLNCNYIAILKLGSPKDMTQICQEYSGEVPREAIENMYMYATQDRGQFFLICTEKVRGRNPQDAFRKNLLEYLNPADFMHERK